MIDLPGMTEQALTLIFLKIQHEHGRKMIDPPGMTEQALT